MFLRRFILCLILELMILTPMTVEFGSFVMTPNVNMMCDVAIRPTSTLWPLTVASIMAYFQVRKTLCGSSRILNIVLDHDLLTVA